MFSAINSWARLGRFASLVLVVLCGLAQTSFAQDTKPPSPATTLTAIGRLITLMKRGKMWVGYCHLEIKTVPSRITILDYFNKTSKNNT